MNQITYIYLEMTELYNSGVTMNRKARKKRKIQLKRMGLEVYIPNYQSIITTSPFMFPFKIAKHFKGMEIQAGKMRGYEFTRPIEIKRRKTRLEEK
jgi:hypothetical protein